MGQHNSGDSHEHGMSLGLYFKVLGVLLVLTVITVVVSRFDFGPWNTLIAMLVASIKAGFVLSFFMHLLWDDKIYWVCFGSAVFFLIILYFFSWLDIATRISLGNIL